MIVIQYVDGKLILMNASEKTTKEYLKHLKKFKNFVVDNSFKKSKYCSFSDIGKKGLGINLSFISSQVIKHLTEMN